MIALVLVSRGFESGKRATPYDPARTGLTLVPELQRIGIGTSSDRSQRTLWVMTGCPRDSAHVHYKRTIGEMKDLSINMERVDRSVGFEPAPMPGGPQKSILGEFEVLGSGAPRCLD